MTLCPLTHTRDGDEKPTNAAPGLVLCWGHRNRMERDIEDLPGLYEDLELRLHPSGPTLKPYTTHDAGGTATVNDRTGEEESETFINGAVADHRDLIWAGLSALARVVVEDRGVTAPEDSHPSVTSRFLLTHVDWLAAQPFADDEAVNLHNLVTRAYKLAFPNGRRRIVCSRCFEVTSCDVESKAEVRCPGTLTATVAREDDLLPSEIACQICGSSWPADRWLTLGRRIHREAS